MHLRIGTSGWHYKHWRGPFYGERCPPAKMLDYYVQHFDTVEVNNSFYKLPEEETFACWREQTPAGFCFAVKASRFITHNKKLSDPAPALDNFLPRAAALREKLGPVLFQLPPKWRVNVERLEEFLKALPRGKGRRYAFEFRNPTWLNDEVYRVLRRHNAAFCIFELAGFTTPLELTADWTYIRLHGPGGKYQGSYTTPQLRRWAERLREWNLREAYVYFDNDQAGYAAQNALELKLLTRTETPFTRISPTAESNSAASISENTPQEYAMPKAKRKPVARETQARKASIHEMPKREARKAEQPKPPYPAQHQQPPGVEAEIKPRPRYQAPQYRPAGKLAGKVALVTGGDSGIGRAVAVLYAKEGADVAIVYMREEQRDAEETERAIEAAGQSAVLIPGDVRDAEFCRRAVQETIEEFGRLDILVNNAAYQQHRQKPEELSEEQWRRTFETNIFGYFFMVRAALPHLEPGSTIINTGSITGLEGSAKLLDYSATKGAIHAFTKSLAQNLVERGIRVNCVAPGPVWTPLNIADKPAEKAGKHGSDTPMQRPAQPEEVAPAYVFFASEGDSSYITGEVLTLLGGETTAA